MTDALIGKLIAQRYLLVARLAEGPSGVVYRAEYGSPPQRVALKLIDPRRLSDSGAAEAVERELESARGIESAHMAKVHEVGRASGGTLFLVMEHLEGETLATRLEREGRLPTSQGLALLAQLGDALSEAHALGLVHGHLQPRKVFLTRRDGTEVVKLLGLGLAPLATVGPSPSSGSLPALLDPHYICPEQTRGAAIDPRSDIYALAALTYTMLCGVPPFAGASPFALLTQHLEATPPALDQRSPEIPAAVAAAVAQALRKAPDQRFPTVVRFIQALRAPPDAATPTAPGPESPLRAVRSQAVALAAPLGGASSLPQDAREAPSADLDQGDKTLIGTGVTADDVQQMMAARLAAATPPPPEQPAADKVVIVKGSDVATLTPEVFGARTLLPSAAAASTPSGAREHAHGAKPTKHVKPTGADDAAEPDTALSPGETTGVSLSEEAREWFAEGAAAEEALRQTRGEPARLPSFYGALEEDALPRRGPSPAVILGGVLGLAALVLGAVFWFSRGSGEDRLDELSKKRVTPGQQPSAATAVTPSPKASPAERPAAAPLAIAPAIALAPTPAATVRPAPTTPSVQHEDTAVAGTPQPVAPPPTPASPPRPAAADEAGFRDPARAAATAATPAPAPRPERASPPARSATRGPRVSDESQRVAAAQVNLGRQRLLRGGYNEARSYFNAAIQLDGRSAEAHGGLGEVAFELGNYVTAAQHLRRAAQLSPGQARFVVMLGDALFKQGRTNDAVAQYRRALALAPNNAAARSGLEAAVRRLAREEN